MKSIKWLLALLLLCLAGVGNVWADHGHGGHIRFGVSIGPYWGPGYCSPYSPYYCPSPYYYPPVVVERAPPPVYIEQQPAPVEATMAPPPAPQTNYWYYCRASKAYYPYVKECPSGWQKELPQPPGQP